MHKGGTLPLFQPSTNSRLSLPGSASDSPSRFNLARSCGGLLNAPTVTKWGLALGTLMIIGLSHTLVRNDSPSVLLLGSLPADVSQGLPAAPADVTALPPAVVQEGPSQTGGAAEERGKEAPNEQPPQDQKQESSSPETPAEASQQVPEAKEEKPVPAEPLNTVSKGLIDSSTAEPKPEEPPKEATQNPPGDDEGPDPSRPSKCSEKCFEHGVCNEELGECFCLPPYGGPDCADLAMPSCQLSADVWSVCKDITTCECAHECQKFALNQNWQCLRGTRADGTRVTNLTELFSGPRYFIQWNENFTDMLPIDYNTPADNNVSPQMNPEECVGKCGGKSACGRQEKNCYCSWATGGRQCEETPAGLRVPCFNGCSGKGECLFGVCKCIKGFFGLDCSLYVDRDGKTRILPRKAYNWSETAQWPPIMSSLKPKIYVYDLPSYFNTWQGLYSNFLDWAEPIWLMERIHNNPFRTANPEEADFFYIPLFIRNRDGNRAGVVRLALKYIQEKYPFWAKSGGKDHFVFTNSDWGNCEMGGTWGYMYGKRNPVVDDMFTLTLWGCSKSMDLDDDRPCFRPQHDIVLPPDQDITVFKFAPGISPDPPKPPFDNRVILLYFRGYIALDKPPWGARGYTWSFGVRQEMWKLYRDRYNETGIMMDTMDSGPWDYIHLRQMLRSIFCAGPAGWGWGMRAPQAVIMGCIPVVIQPHTYQAYDGDGLDWKDFGVVLNFEDIPNLEKILREIPPEEIARKRAAMEAIRNRFIWSSTNYNPYQFLPKEEQEARAPHLLESDAFIGLIDALRQKMIRSGKKLG